MRCAQTTNMSITVINGFFDITILLVIRVINYLFNFIIVITRAIIAAQFIVEIDGQLPLYSHIERNDADEEDCKEDGNGDFDAFSKLFETPETELFMHSSFSQISQLKKEYIPTPESLHQLLHCDSGGHFQLLSFH